MDQHAFPDLPPRLSQRLHSILQQRGWLPPQWDFPDSLALRNLGSLAHDSESAASKVLDNLYSKYEIKKSTSAVIMQEVKMQRQALGLGTGLSPAGGGRVSAQHWQDQANAMQRGGNAAGFTPPRSGHQSTSPLNATAYQANPQQKPPTLSHQRSRETVESDYLLRREPVTPEKSSPAPAMVCSPPSPERPPTSVQAQSPGSVRLSQGGPVVRKLDPLLGPPRAKSPRIGSETTRHASRKGTHQGGSADQQRNADVSNASLGEWDEGVPGSQQSFAFPRLETTPPIRFETPPPEEAGILINANALSQQGLASDTRGLAESFSRFEPPSGFRSYKPPSRGAYLLDPPETKPVGIERTPSSLPLEDKHVLCVTHCETPPLPSSQALRGLPNPSPGLPNPSPSLPNPPLQPITGTWRLETSSSQGPHLVLEAIPGGPVHTRVPLRWEQPLPLPPDLQEGNANLLRSTHSNWRPVQIAEDGSLQGVLWGQTLVNVPRVTAAREAMPPGIQKSLLHGSGMTRDDVSTSSSHGSRVHGLPGSLGGRASLGAPDCDQSTPLRKAFGELEFKKRWLVEYHGGHNLSTLSQTVDDVTLTSSLVAFRSSSLLEIEARLLSFLPRAKHRKLIALVLTREDPDANVVYAVKVRKNRTVELMAPALEKAGTAGGRLFDYDRLLTVYIEDIQKHRATCESVLRDSLTICARTYAFLLPKDATNRDVRILFLALSSDAATDARAGFSPYDSIDDARARVAHFHTCANAARGCSWQIQAHLLTLFSRRSQDSRGAALADELIHTDGNVFISEDLAKLVPAGISQGCLPKEKSGHDIPLVIQFRLFHEGEAFKGTVTLNRLLPPNTLVLPGSCRKVARDHAWAEALPRALSSFEVCQSSQEPSGEARLNQQLILLLWHGGVPTETFMRLLDDALEALLTSCTDVAAAYKVANSFGSDDRPKQQALDALIMLTSGFDMHELRLRSIVRTLQKERFVELSRGRIPVKRTYSNLMGIADPTGQLAPDEVMVILLSAFDDLVGLVRSRERLEDELRLPGNFPISAGRSAVLTSEKVLLFRQPGLHPGDIRVFKIQKVPANGPRSAADMMAGGDLDGDPYWVCFNEELCAPFQPSDPMERLQPSGVRPEPLPNSADELNAKLREHFLTCAFAIQGAIGGAQRNWLAHADWGSQDERPIRGGGPGSATCLALNEIYCRALDAGKSGEKVSVPPELLASHYPSYMEKGKETRERGGNLTAFTEYESKSVLGRIYQRVYPLLHEAQEKPEEVIFDEDLKLDLAGNNAPVWTQWTKWLHEYNQSVREAMSGHRADAREAAMEQVKLKYKRLLWQQHLPRDVTPADADIIARLESAAPPDDVILAARAAYSVTYSEANAAYERGRDGRQPDEGRGG
ncbi:RNA-dependent RNA polymerase [Klebsormidium nitens]|uniref:RNA-dependent RNA polymerase n=1 Tax=Klebsormidium nitens TaxID=105231 RepID=A0A1Y1HNV7_KLENI|nr:RNA-dependent RNA polymerase [Klebsormidium nitens]|eukprot:GAQ80334.1 RNA-dependent RNA polymerase [Klebsormidium nitens]